MNRLNRKGIGRKRVLEFYWDLFGVIGEFFRGGRVISGFFYMGVLGVDRFRYVFFFVVYWLCDVG